MLHKYPLYPFLFFWRTWVFFICSFPQSSFFLNWLLSVQLNVSLCSLFFLHIGSWMQRFGQTEFLSLARFLVVLYSFIRGTECLIVFVCVWDISSHCCLMARFNSVTVAKWWHFNYNFFNKMILSKMIHSLSLWPERYLD